MPSSTIDAVVSALRTAARPLTRGEFAMFPKLGTARRADVQAALDELEADGLVVGRDALIPVRWQRGRWSRPSRLYALAAGEGRDGEP